MGREPPMGHPLQAAEIRPSLVNLVNLEQDPGPYGMSFGFDLDLLVRSIREIGLINAPCVTEKPSGQMNIITGYRRVMAARALEWSGLPCRDLTPLDLSPLHLLVLALKDNMTTRVFNDVEKGMVLSRLATHVPREQVLNQYMPMLHLPSNDPLLTLFLDLEEADTDIKKAVSNGRLPLRNVKRLLELQSGSRDMVFYWLSNMKFNANQQVQFIETIEDISRREKKGIHDILEEKEMLRLFHDDKRNNPQKAKHVLEVLRRRRFPMLTKTEQAFRKQIAGLVLPNGITIHHPPHFEGSQYQLEACFKNGTELRKRLEKLVRMKDLDKVGDPWEES
ncbi:ParB/RepB/Spo0J family partition protein [Thermodesulfobacteriota bacterium]